MKNIKKFMLVEEAFQNGDEIVFYDNPHNTVYVCFGGCEVKGKEIHFKDCSIADIGEDQEEYYGEILNGSMDVYFRLDEKINPNCIPTIYHKGELVEVICMK